MLLKQVSTFDKFILLAGCLGIYVVLYKLQWTANEIKVSENPWNPGWMLFGPLLYIAMRTHAGITISRKACLHLIPAFLVTAMYGLIWAATSVHHPLANCLLYYYQNAYLVIAFSFYSYSYLTLNKLYSAKNTPTTDLLVISSAIYIIIATLMVLMFLCWNVFKVDMGLDYRFFTFFLLLSMSVCVFRYLASAKTTLPEKMEEPVPMYSNSMLSPEMAETYCKMVTDCFDQTDIYLKSDLSLELLSKTLEIPKHILSQIFTVHLKLTFYKFVAQYRISYAIAQMKSSNGILTIEHLAYECGFNSKTSFNKYFKEITGLTPQEYQRNYLDTQQTP